LYARTSILSDIEEAPTSEVDRTFELYKNLRALLVIENRE